MRDNYFTYCMNKEEKWMGYKLGQSSIRPLGGRQRLREIIFDESVDIWNVALYSDLLWLERIAKKCWKVVYRANIYKINY